MIKHTIDRIEISQMPIQIIAPPSPGDASQLAQIDAYNGEMLCAVLRFFDDGTDLPLPKVNDGVVVLFFNLAQFAVAAAMKDEADVVVYFKSETDAGITCGQDPFERTGPIRL